MRSLADDLRARTDDDLAALLIARPDLARPAASDLTALAARSTTRSSTARAIDGLDLTTLQVLEAAAEAGATSAFYTVLRLPWELNAVFQQWLEQHYPQRAARVMARIREMRGGRDYDADFSTRMKGSGVWAQLLGQRFEKACARLGLNRARTPLELGLFRPAALSAQQSLF